MTRPQIIRADTLDLQDQDAPSAQDHTRQPAHPEPFGAGPAAPHQDASLRHVAEERHAEQDYMADTWGPGRSYHDGSEVDDEESERLLANAVGDQAMQQNGRHTANADDSGMIADDGDDQTDDDTLDKISSSPSIADDGGYNLLLARSNRQSSFGVGNTTEHRIERVLRHTPELSCLTSTAARQISRLSISDRDMTLIAGEPSLQTHSNVSFSFYPHVSLKDLSRLPSDDHHLYGEYISLPGDSKLARHAKDPAPCRNYEVKEENSFDSFDLSLVPESVESLFRSSSLRTKTKSNAARDDMDSVLLSSNGPLLDCNTHMSPTSPTSSSSSWVSASDDEPTFSKLLAADDDSKDISFSSDTRFVDSGWGGECLREVEEIDFEFVYALHTFVATVEGQANATKGDTMVLLDDSNSYWWLVRIVKDSSIGYLPAEHIETPTERLARLNKHRNIDLSATMLGDNPEKSKNPLKKAMRRRNAKIVQFTTPTYFEPDGIDWTDIDNDREDSDDLDLDIKDRRKQHQGEREAVVVEESDNINGDHGQQIISRNGLDEMEGQDSGAALDRETFGDETLNRHDSIPSRSRNGTIRNTDSFFKDDTAEPKKISLTPNLLRNDSSFRSGRSSESREKANNNQEMFDQIEKTSPTTEKMREDRKKKEKKLERKTGMLSGLFKRKDKRLKVDEATGGVVARPEGDVLGSTLSPSDSGQASPIGPQSLSTQQQFMKRQGSNGKLIKSTPPGLTTPLASLSNLPNGTARPLMEGSQAILMRPKPPGAFPSESTIKTVGGLEVGSTPEFQSRQPLSVQIPVTVSTEQQAESPQVESKSEEGVLSPLTTLLSSKASDPTRETLKKTKERQGLAVDASPEAEATSISPFNDTPVYSRNTMWEPPPRPAPEPVRNDWSFARSNDLVSPIEGPPRSDLQPPSLMIDTSPRKERSVSPISPSTPDEGAAESFRMPSDMEPKSSTETSSYSVTTGPESLANDTASSPSTAPAPATPPLAETSHPVWNDASLRAYLDESSNIAVKDLLLIVHDKTGVVPVRHNHPIMIDIGFDAQKQRLDDISKRLDGLLNGFLARRGASKSNTGAVQSNVS